MSLEKHHRNSVVMSPGRGARRHQKPSHSGLPTRGCIPRSAQAEHVAAVVEGHGQVAGQIPGFRVSGFGFRVSSFGYRAEV